jgi:hypothetical protein
MKLALPLLALSLLAAPSFARADPLPYSEGSVWMVDFVKVKPGFMDDYLRSLSATWKALAEAGKKDGLILSYKIIDAEHANPEDWDLMLMVEYKNMAALDGLREKLHALSEKVVGDEASVKKIQTKRLDVREVFGGKVGRELILK